MLETQKHSYLLRKHTRRSRHLHHCQRERNGLPDWCQLVPENRRRLMTASGIYTPVKGSIHFDGNDITTISAEERVILGISQVPEGRLIFPDMSVLENLDLGAYSRNDKDGIKNDFRQNLSVFPHPAGIGRNSVAAASAVANNRCWQSDAHSCPSRNFSCWDEPSLGLAPLIVKQIFEIIQQINADGTTILLVEQNAQIALQVTDRGYVMETGEITIEGASDDLLADERVRQAYLGE